MAESLKRSPSLSRSDCTSPAGLDDSAGDHSQSRRGTMSRRTALNSDCACTLHRALYSNSSSYAASTRDDASSSTQNLGHADCHSLHFQDFFQDPVVCDDHRLVDIYSAFSALVPNNRLDPYPLCKLTFVHVHSTRLHHL